MTMVRPEIPLQVITADIVRASIKRARKSLEAAATEIIWQIEREAWRTLGYSSWSAMREAEYGGAAFMVPSKSRPELVERMRAKGLTQQEIAKTAGVSVGTVNGDLKFSSENEPAPITNSRGQQRPATYARAETDDVIDAEIVDDEGPIYLNEETGEVLDAPTATPDAAPVATEHTCPTCHGTGKVTS